MFPSSAAGRAAELTGVEVTSRDLTSSLRLAWGWHTLALLTTASGQRPVVAEHAAGPGRIVASVLPNGLDSSLAHAFRRGQRSRVLIPLMLLRRLYGLAAWHPPAAMANFTVDDPALREGTLDLRYSLIAQVAPPTWRGPASPCSGGSCSCATICVLDRFAHLALLPRDFDLLSERAEEINRAASSPVAGWAWRRWLGMLTFSAETRRRAGRS